jgi:thiosulfate reductase cytochrome b subunit
MSITHVKTMKYPIGLVLLAMGLLMAALFLTVHQQAEAQGSPMHPTFPLLDADGENVLESGNPVSTMETCGGCHDTAFIAEHSFHTDVGFSELTTAGTIEGGEAWDTSPGYFGRWDPLLYRYLSPQGDRRIDLATAEWIQVFGPRHVGGGPAAYGQDGKLLTETFGESGNPANYSVDPETGQLAPWDWRVSGIVEMNCFLCHFSTPNSAARTAALTAGEFQWANTATLSGTGIVDQVEGQWTWNQDAFDQEGNLKSELLTPQEPADENCGQCHGLVHSDAQTPVTLAACQTDQWSTITTGQVFSPQRLSDTGLNFEDKDVLTQPWDIHAERVVACIDCHYSLSNPIYYQEPEDKQPDYLVFDPRRVDFGEYLYRPLHQFATGDTGRQCADCHDAENTHDWLPYTERHLSALSCETCHIPELYAPAREYNDWTVLKANDTPRTACRGVDTSSSTDLPLLSGYQPVLLPKDNGDGTTSLAPHNLIASWYWVYGDPERPVRLFDLRAAWFDGDAYRADVLATFDANGDGSLDDTELIINSEAKETLIAANLTALGLENPRISGEVRPYSIAHDVVTGDAAIKDCKVCHSDSSRLDQPILLANQVPYGVQPKLISSTALDASGDLVTNDQGQLYYEPKLKAENIDLYIFGHSRVDWVDWLGALLFVGVLGGIATHSTLRFYLGRRRASHDPELKRVYMYSVYERQWHWLQTAAILFLLFTGLIIHKPDMFGIFKFPYVVQVHNVLAIILLINAFLAAFYHFASGDIRQFLPKPYGFFDQAFEQAKYYLHGIFRGDSHPFEKTHDRKMNPLQQITYLAILNVLLPLQVITGALMWGAQRWPEEADRLGGLGTLAPFHTLIAWLFASFIVGHVYLTTTEHTPITGIKSMITGWSELEAEPSGEEK